MAFLIVLTVFACPVAIIALLAHYRYKMRLLASGGGGGGEAERRLLARCEELERRVQTLETIACEGDADVAARVRALAAEGRKALPEKAGSGGGSGG
jgi:hypothetical protein